MIDRTLANLRRARIRCHKSLKQAEAQVERYKTKLATIEAAIYAFAPELEVAAPVPQAKPDLCAWRV